MKHWFYSDVLKSMEITLPKPPKIRKTKDNSASFEIEELYPGYGMTLGNALRRVLLSSLPGTAVTFMKIKGVSHEFSTIPHVLENVIDIMLNVKQLRFKMYTNEPQTLTIKKKGEGPVLGSDIEGPSDVEVINKDHVIANLTDKNADFEMELIVEKGLGYVPVENRKKEKLQVGLIAVDAVFTPVRKVNYEVEDMRVGDRTDFNKIILTLETDGSISPEDAFKKAVDILVNQFSALRGDVSDVTSSEKEVSSQSEEVTEAKEEDVDTVKKLKVSELDLSQRTVHALEDAGIKTVAGLLRKSEDDLLELEGFGDKALDEVKSALKKLGLSLK